MVRPEDVPSAFNFPLAQPPPGVIPNFEHPHSLAPVFIRASAVCLPIMVIFICARVAARLVGLTKKSLVNDVIFAMATLVALTESSIWIAQAIEGPRGRYLYETLLLQYAPHKFKMEHANNALWSFAIYLVKLGIAFFFLDIFGRLRWLKLSIYSFIAVLTAFHLTAIVVYIPTCEPVSDTTVGWILAYNAPNCFRIANFAVAQGAFHAATDLFLLLIPLPAVWSLQLPFKRKVGVMAMFSTGSCAFAASLWGLSTRIHTRRKIGADIRLAVWIWTAGLIELTAGMMILCIPAVTALSKQYKPLVQSRLSSTYVTLFRPFISKTSRPSDSETGSDSLTTLSNGAYRMIDRPGCCSKCGSRTKQNDTSNGHIKLHNDRSNSILPCHACRDSSKPKHNISVSEVQIPTLPKSCMKFSDHGASFSSDQTG